MGNKILKYVMPAAVAIPYGYLAYGKFYYLANLDKLPEQLPKFYQMADRIGTGSAYALTAATLLCAGLVFTGIAVEGARALYRYYDGGLEKKVVEEK